MLFIDFDHVRYALACVHTFGRILVVSTSQPYILSEDWVHRTAHLEYNGQGHVDRPPQVRH